MSAEPNAKYRKLQELRKSIPFASKSSLAAIIGHIRKQGLPDGGSSKDMRAANRQQLALFNGYGPLLQEEKLVMINGESCSLLFINLMSLLHGAYKRCLGFHQLLKSTLDKYTEPLHLMVYADEITPGNVLSHSPSRKLWCIYVSFEEFKHHSLSENGWLTLCLLRSDMASKVEAHLSQIVKVILLSIFCNNCCIGDVGLQLQEIDGTPVPKRLKMKLGCFIMDGQAQKLAWACKGDSGSRFCTLCSNIFQSHGSTEEEEELVNEISKHCRYRDLCLNSNTDILASWDRMSSRAASDMPKGEFKLWEQASGISWSSHALLACKELRHVMMPADQFCHDWMHGLLSNGVLCKGTFNLLQALDMWEVVQGYVEQWHLPHAVSNLKPSALFEAKRISKHKKSQKLNSTASELLCVLPILAHFARVACLPTGTHTQEIEAFLSLVLVVEILQACSYTSVQPAALLAAIERYLKLWVDLGWHMLKKHHWLLHLPTFLSKHHWLPNCFCMERKNKMISRHANIVQNTRSFERSLYEEVTTFELEKLSAVDCFATGVYLIDPKPLTKKLKALASAMWDDCQDTLQTFKAMGQHGCCTKGDVVLLQSAASKFDAGEVLVFLSHLGESLCVVKALQLQQLHPCHALWQEVDTLVAVPLHIVLLAAPFAKDHRGITTLTPWHLR
ncbi:unnamed protein product [Durusdinium trenchii]|uniref:Uncharacterized protein n=1 Tax=Durusdinium trenchii TaxID=1381693 RepID=A0ABP0NTU1_9DINO